MSIATVIGCSKWTTYRTLKVRRPTEKETLRAAKVKKSMNLDQVSDSRNRKETMPKTRKKFSF